MDIFSKTNDGLLKREISTTTIIKYDYQSLLSDLANAQAEVVRIEGLINECKKLNLDK